MLPLAIMERTAQGRCGDESMWDAIIAAIRYVAAEIIEGFADCAVGMYPQLLHPPEEHDVRGVATRDPAPNQSASDHAEAKSHRDRETRLIALIGINLSPDRPDNTRFITYWRPRNSLRAIERMDGSGAQSMSRSLPPQAGLAHVCVMNGMIHLHPPRRPLRTTVAGKLSEPDLVSSRDDE